MCSAYMKTEPIAHAPNTTSKCTHTFAGQSNSLNWDGNLFLCHTPYARCMQNSNVSVKQRVGSKITCRADAISNLVSYIVKCNNTIYCISNNINHSHTLLKY